MKGKADIIKVKPPKDFRKLSHRLLHLANRGLLRIDFLREISNVLMDFSDCDEVELRVEEGSKYYLCRVSGGNVNSFSFEVVPSILADEGGTTDLAGNITDIERLCQDIIIERVDSSLLNYTEYGSFWTDDVSKYSLDAGAGIKSLAIFPIRLNRENMGLLLLKSLQSNFFLEEEIEWYEDVVKIIGIAINQRRTQVMLRERVKELTCLYGIAKITASPDLSLDKILQDIVELLPPGWLYPEAAQGRIIYDGKTYLTPGFCEGCHRQSADIIINDDKCGFVEVIYKEEKPELDEGPFLKEERSLLNAIARELGLIIERKAVSEERERLREQLRHADRLATIGQLAAGVAHELNEPLGNILGFAQLSLKCEGVPKLVSKDLQKIVDSSLHAREIIKKLLVFARQTPSRMVSIELNSVVEECLDLLSSRLVKEGIELRLSLVSDMPNMTADPSQINQVIVNLVVNSMQAMPDGGVLVIKTSTDGDFAYLIVEDTGSGIEADILKQIFIPFFTTKDVDQGTGLGLAVVHGIVTSHGGSVRVESEIGRGSRFEIQLPLVNKR
ncbi:MAG: hypothetical protein HQ591_00425 [candidate division Zixibacteria bacterium]|nr:hypothetical protein [Candidatus Tariuqbacter arcticus]